MTVQLESNGWNTTARIRVIGGNRPSIIGRELMDKLGLKLIQKQLEGTVMMIDRDAADNLGPQMTPCQEHISKQFAKLFNRVGKIRNYKVQADFFEQFNPLQEKGRRVLIALQENEDKKITKLLEQGHIEKLTKCSDKNLVLLIIITVRKDGSVKLALESRELNKQMQNIEELMDTVGQTISERRFFFNNGFDVRVWATSSKSGYERSV